MSDQEKLQRAWLDQVQEEIIDPERPIIDPHHHLWRHPGIPPYLLDDLLADTGSGHNIEKTVFMECGAEYRSEGPEHLRSLGEVEFVTGLAQESARRGEGSAEIAALVSYIDLLAPDQVADTVAMHEEASHGLFRGVRHAGSLDP
ncbi:MAG: amidohydrolase, partial [Halieaceae bacterium]|nr:amidohydrolase [Halieaceae bacterium]